MKYFSGLEGQNLKRGSILKIGKCIYLLLLILSLESSFCYSLDSNKVVALSLNKIVNKKITKGSEKYIDGKSIYKNFSYFNLNNDFKIKKTPDIFFYKSDIDFIYIEKMPFSTEKNRSYEIEFFINSRFGEKIEKFTKKNKGESFSIKLCGEDLTIIDIYEKFRNNFKISINNIDESKIKKLLESCSVKYDVNF